MLSDKSDNLWKKKLHDIFSVFLEICEKNNLRYYCYAGTALGAVRHHGIIPWDDDIDVAMPRPDYNRLLDILEHKPLQNYQLITPESCKTYYLPHAKLFDKTTTLLEVKRFKCVIGVNIDIFPLDGTCSDPSVAEKLYNQYNKKLNYFKAATAFYSIKDMMNMLLKLKIRTFLRTTFFCISKPYSRRIMLKAIRKIENLYDYDSSDMVINYIEYYGFNKGFYQKKWFDNGYKTTFGTETVIIPNQYDNYLKKM